MSDGTLILDDAELDHVNGGLKECAHGTTSGGNPGSYPDYATCATTWDQAISDFVNIAVNIVNGHGK
jgi:hypothetical protein